MEPIILIGRGGGGTRLLSELAHRMGIFLGNTLNISFDSVEWVKPVYGMVIETLSHSVDPGSDRDEFWCHEMHAKAREILQKAGKSPRDPWGWKLPETTLVIPQVARYFPNAKFVHLTRHPVTSCCRRTHMTSRMDSELGRSCLTAAYTHIGRPIAQIETDPTHIHNAASWVYQVEIALNALENSNDTPHAITVKYEDLCHAPAKIQKRLSQLLATQPPEGDVGLRIDLDRLNNKKTDDKEAVEVWNICGPQANRLGYGWK